MRKLIQKNHEKLLFYCEANLRSGLFDNFVVSTGSRSRGPQRPMQPRGLSEIHRDREL
jgi:hypothetical protein